MGKARPSSDRRPLEPIEQSSVVVAAAKALRNEILRRSDDDMFLGSETELVRWLGISQPTFRQAARLLEYEELLTVRRGVGGGFFGRRPSAEVVAKMAGIYLLAQGASFGDVMRAQHVLENEIIREVAENSDRAVRGRLAQFVRDSAELQAPDDIPGAFRAINNYWRLAGELAGNQLFTLFVLASQAYGARAGGFNLTPARAAAYATCLAEVSEAIEAGDGEGAVALRMTFSDKMMAWTREDSAATARAARKSGGQR